MKEGLEKTHYEQFTISDHNKMWWSFNECMLYEEMTLLFERKHPSPESALRVQACRKMVEGAAGAAKKGIAICSILVMAIGQKKHQVIGIE